MDKRPTLAAPTPRPDGARLEDMGVRTLRSKYYWHHSDDQGEVFWREDRKFAIRLRPHELARVNAGETVYLDFGRSGRGEFQADWTKYDERVKQEQARDAYRKQREWEASPEGQAALAERQAQVNRAIVASFVADTEEADWRSLTRGGNMGFSDPEAAREQHKQQHFNAVKKALELGIPVPPKVLATYPQLTA